MYTKLVKKIALIIERRNGHCSDNGGSGTGHCS